MKHIFKFAVAFSAAFFIAGASEAQSPGTVTNHAIPIGKGAGSTGFGNAAPGTSGIPLASNGASTDPSFHPVANAGIAAGAANTIKGSVDGATTSDLAIASCSALYNFTQWVSGSGWQCGINPVLPSRTIAATLNLSAFSAITTQGYAAPGDGGGATFKKAVGGAALVDSFITTYTITGGSGYTNASYFGVVLVNTTKPYAIGTATVSGGIVTAVNITGTPGGLCHVGDVYTTGSIPGGTGFQITVTGCSAPLGSLTDSVGTNFQINYAGSSPNAFQFGAIGDWAGTDGSATDNFNALQAGLWMASFMNQLNSGNGGFWGGRLWVPQGTFFACGTGLKSLIVPNGVKFEGASDQGSVIKMCDTFAGSVNFVELCDPNWHFACFSSRLDNLQLFATRTAASSGGFAMVHSNATQDFGGVSHVYIYGGLRQCLILEKGYGGASTMEAHHISCSTDSASPQIVFGNTVASGLNLGTTIINAHDISLGGSSSGGVYQSASGILIEGGFVNIDGAHCESMPVCVEVNNAAAIASGMIRLNNINAGSGAPAPTCTGVVQLDSTNTPGNMLISMTPAGSCTNTITNIQAAGTNFTVNIMKPITCVSGACS